MTAAQGAEWGSKTNLEAWVSDIELTWRDTPEFKVPDSFKHLAIICDGNRRAAVGKGLKPYDGHRAGIEVIKGIMKASRNWGIRHLTFWTWSTENWKRDEEQVGFVMGLAAKHLADSESLRTLVENRTKFTHLGRKDRLFQGVVMAIDSLERNTAGFNDRFVNLALDYGGLDELARAVVKMFEDTKRGKLNDSDLLSNPEIILHYLDTSGQPIPDLVVRTGTPAGEIPHTSGFMPLQTGYAGWVFLPQLFPDLKPGELLGTIQEFIAYERRIGK